MASHKIVEKPLPMEGLKTLRGLKVFAGNANLVRDVMVGGEWVVREHRHRDAERIARRYRGVVERLARA